MLLNFYHLQIALSFHLIKTLLLVSKVQDLVKTVLSLKDFLRTMDLMIFKQSFAPLLVVWAVGIVNGQYPQ